MTDDIRSTLGLPPDWTDEQVTNYLSDLRARALGNLAGPSGYVGISEGAGVVVYETYTSSPMNDAIADFTLPSEFDGAVDMIQFNNYENGTRIQVRVKKETA